MDTSASEAVRGEVDSVRLLPHTKSASTAVDGPARPTSARDRGFAQEVSNGFSRAHIAHPFLSGRGHVQWISVTTTLTRATCKPEGCNPSTELPGLVPALLLSFSMERSEMGKHYRHGKRGAGRHVQLPEWLQASEAWATMKPGPRALYIEVKRRYNGGNNGQILISHRQAAKLLNLGRDTVGIYFQELLDRGFLRITRGHCLGPSGIGQAASYAITEERVGMAGATKDFMRWKK